jgi:hypothetical protein
VYIAIPANEEEATLTKQGDFSLRYVLQEFRKAKARTVFALKRWSQHTSTVHIGAVLEAAVKLLVR